MTQTEHLHVNPRKTAGRWLTTCFVIAEIFAIARPSQSIQSKQPFSVSTGNSLPGFCGTWFAAQLLSLRSNGAAFSTGRCGAVSSEVGDPLGALGKTIKTSKNQTQEPDRSPLLRPQVEARSSSQSIGVTRLKTLSGAEGCDQSTVRLAWLAFLLRHGLPGRFELRTAEA